MKKLGVMVAAAGLLFGTIAAHAAPTPTPQRPTPAPTGGPVLKVKPGIVIPTVEAKVVELGGVCGQSTKARVALRNSTSASWTGAINFVGAASTTPVTLGAAGRDDATKTIDVVGPKLDCQKPLGVQGIRVWKSGSEANPLLAQVLKPKKVSALRDFSMNAPPSTETKVWLRRLTFEATCGGNVTATAMLHSHSQAPQQATMKLAFGVYAQEPTTEVRGLAAVQYGAPSPLDCNAAGGLPAFEYTLLTGLGANGRIDSYEITFE